MSKIEDTEDQGVGDAVEITTEETGKEETIGSPSEIADPEKPNSEEYLTTAEDHDWSFFVTLSSNDRSRASKSLAPSFANSGTAEAFMRDRLRRWDARVNRALLGKHWLVRPEERIEAFGVLEKPGCNPHWHLLVKLRCRHPKRDFSEAVEEAWLALVAAGSVDIQPVDGMVGLSRYMTKTMPYGSRTDLTAILPEISARSCK
eukprot:s1_g808.t1